MKNKQWITQNKRQWTRHLWQSIVNPMAQLIMKIPDRRINKVIKVDNIMELKMSYHFPQQQQHLNKILLILPSLKPWKMTL